MSNKQERFTKDKGCSLCGNMDYTRIVSSISSNIICSNCKAIFKSPDDGNTDEAGLFTGRYAPMDKNVYFKHRHTKEGGE